MQKKMQISWGNLHFCLIVHLQGVADVLGGFEERAGAVEALAVLS